MTTRRKTSPEMSPSPGEQSPFRKVTDHGQHTTSKLPEIPCSKYIVIGNPKMRVKRTSAQRSVWRVPQIKPSSVATRNHNESRFREGATVGREKPGDTVRRSERIKRRQPLNFFDQKSLYSVEEESSFRSIQEKIPTKIFAAADDLLQRERHFIDNFYRQRSSALLSPIPRRPTKTLSVSLPTIPQEGTGDQFGQIEPKKAQARWTQQSWTRVERFHSKACLYCDVVGQKYCSNCRRKHKQAKAYESILANVDRHDHGGMSEISSGAAADPQAREDAERTRQKGKGVMSAEMLKDQKTESFSSPSSSLKRARKKRLEPTRIYLA
ncbi:uncharacterized protein [Diadema setosum]|uniref:uncharacterized protein n=1 Tax=Diadema setosum TaxID=31175 RepID=UPI003B3A6782